MTYYYSNERMSHCVVDAKLVPVYDRDNPPQEVAIQASTSFAMSMNSDAMRKLLDAMSKSIDTETLKVALYTNDYKPEP